MSETTAPYGQNTRQTPLRWRRWVLLALAALALVTARVLHDSWVALGQGAVAETRGDYREAVDHYLHAVRMYVPASPFVGRALVRLTALAEAAAQDGDLEEIGRASCRERV